MPDGVTLPMLRGVVIGFLDEDELWSLLEEYGEQRKKLKAISDRVDRLVQKFKLKPQLKPRKKRNSKVRYRKLNLPVQHTPIYAKQREAITKAFEGSK